MAHTSEIRWSDVATRAVSISVKMVDTLQEAENIYQDLLELYQYTNTNAQELADQLFKENWEARSTPGTKARITYDVLGGEITTVTIANAGTGYVDGTNFELNVPGGDSSGVIRYDVVGGVFTNASVFKIGMSYVDGTNYVLDDETPEPPPIFDTQANADEVAKATDLIEAMTSIHELYQAADNVIVTQEDRFSKLRRFT